MADQDSPLLALTAPAARHVSVALEAAPGSPLRARSLEASPDPAAAARDLGAKGVSLEGEVTGDGARYRAALEVLARPEALVRVRIAEPGQPTTDIAVLLRGETAAPLVMQDKTLLVGPARPLADLAGSLVAQVQPDPALSGQQIVLWPSVLKALTIVWGVGQDASTRIARPDVEARLTQAGLAADKAKAVVDELVAGGIVVAGGDGLEIVPAYRPFLDRVWSGHALQIEYLLLTGAPTFEHALGLSGPRLLFMGAAGGRILNEHVKGEALTRWLAGARAAEDHAIRLAGPPAEAVTKLVGLLVRLEKAPAGASS